MPEGPRSGITIRQLLHLLQENPNGSHGLTSMGMPIERETQNLHSVGDSRICGNLTVQF